LSAKNQKPTVITAPAASKIPLLFALVEPSLGQKQTSHRYHRAPIKGQRG